MQRRRVVKYLCGSVLILWLWQRQRPQATILDKPTTGPLLRLHADTDFGLDKSRNPVNASRAILHDDDLAIDAAGFTGFATANKKSSIGFDCNSASNSKPCPRSYKVLFVGPTVHSPRWEHSHRQSGSRRIVVDYAIRDPGKYLVYAWPEYEECDKWNSMDDPWSSRLVVGSPFELIVKGTRPDEPSQACPLHHEDDSHELDATNGRWVSLEHIRSEHFQPTSPHFWWLKDQIVPVNMNVWWAVKQRYAWLPYKCKRPSMSNRAWIELIKPLSVLVIGDSTLRDYFCIHLWTEVGGWPQGFCDPGNPNYHRTNKDMVYHRHDGGDTTLKFLWSPKGDSEVLAEYLKSSGAPTHILLNSGLWLAKTPPAEFAKIMKAQMEVFRKYSPMAKIALRESGSAVQSINCYERIGGFRHTLEAQNAVIGQIARTYRKSLDVSVVPFYDITNDRPDTSIDGRHWSGMSDGKGFRPQQGACEVVMADFLWWRWFDKLQ